MLLSPKLLSYLHQWKSRFPKRNEKVFSLFKFNFETYFLQKSPLLMLEQTRSEPEKIPNLRLCGLHHQRSVFSLIFK